MRICHLTSAHKSEDTRILKKECVSLAKRNENEVFLIARGNSWTYKGVKIVGIGYSQCGRLSRMLKVPIRIYKEALRIDADIYHFHDPELLIMAYFLKKRNKRVIFDSHELYSKQIFEKDYIPFFLRKTIGKIYEKLEQYVCKRIDGVIFPCLINEKHPFAGVAKNYEIIDNLPMAEELIDIEGKNIAYKNKKVQVCCTGSLTPERGILQLAEACNGLNIKLVLAGNFYPKSFGDELLKREDLKDTIDYRGYCDRNDILSIYAETQIGASTILPIGQYSQLSNLPTKVYEFMMASMPFIISNFSYAEQFIKKNNCGLAVDPSNVDEIKDAISFLINNSEYAEILGKNGRKCVEEQFCWEREEKKLYTFYNNIYCERDVT